MATEPEHCSCRGCTKAYKQGRDAERARIKAAVEALGPLLSVDKHKGGYDCCGCSTMVDLFDDVLSIIDGKVRDSLATSQEPAYNGDTGNRIGQDAASELDKEKEVVLRIGSRIDQVRRQPSLSDDGSQGYDGDDAA